MFEYLAVGLLCFALGLHLSHFGPQHQTLIRRLKNINRVAEATLSDVREFTAEGTDGTLAKEVQCLHDATVFAALESDLSLSVGKYRSIVWKRWRRI